MKHRNHLTLTAAIAIAACGPLDPSDPSEEEGADQSSISRNDVGWISSEPNEASTGRYPEVMYAVAPGGCTGTVIGPHAVLTAKHCTDGTTNGTWITWNGVPMTVTKILDNPYLDPAYTPSWWLQLNDQQKAAGGRQDDWPAQHDQVVLFIPTLTADFIAQNRITVAKIDPYLPANNYWLVGVGSTGGGTRNSVPTQFVSATPNQITAMPRDGYLTRDWYSGGYGTADGGDSGGPTFGSMRYPVSPSGAPVLEAGRHLVGTTQNQYDLAPLAYTPGMTPNQSLTVRLNQLWLRSAREDADGDDLPSACDSDPTNPIGSANLCPTFVGAPFFITKLMPTGLLECREGYVPTGLVGGSGALIDRLALRCRALSCFSGGGAGCDEYTTDAFGGGGGGQFDRICPTNAVLTAIWGFQASAFGSMTSLGAGCTDFAQLRNGSLSRTWTTYAGAYSNEPFTRSCGEAQVMIGIEARTNDKRFVTGLQPICSDAPVRSTRHVGGQGGAVRALRCPSDSVAIGSVQRSTSNWVLDQFGLICAPKQEVIAGSISSANLFVIHAGFHDQVGGYDYPEQAVRYSTYLGSRPSWSTETRCPAGHQLAGFRLRAGALIDRIDTIICAPSSLDWGWQLQDVGVGVGGWGGGATSVWCPSSDVVGLFTRNGWLLEGFALECSDGQ